MSNENAGRTGRTNGAAPMGSTVAIAVTLVALVLGFLILCFRRFHFQMIFGRRKGARFNRRSRRYRNRRNMPMIMMP